MSEINNSDKTIEKKPIEKSPTELQAEQDVSKQRFEELKKSNPFNPSAQIDSTRVKDNPDNAGECKTDKQLREEELKKAKLPQTESGIAGDSPPEVKPEKFKYEHDPMDNPKSARDITPDENAVYGFKPSDTGSIKQYACYDWSNPDVVASARQRREEYHNKNDYILDEVKKMTVEGCSNEEIGRYANHQRNQNRFDDYRDRSPEDLDVYKQRNLEKYGNEFGMTAEQAYEKYGSWDKVIEKSMDSNPGMDACCGLYDKYYNRYLQ